MIQVYVLVSFWDDNGLHKAGTFTEVKEENFDPYYMQKAGGSVDAYTKAETNALLEAKQDDLTAGTNITISDQDVISATDTGDTVSVTQVQTTGTKIATVTVNSVGTDIYAPAGGSGSSVTKYIVLKSDSQRVKLEDIDNSLSNCTLINDATSNEANFEAVSTACAAGKVILAFPANEWLGEDAYAEVDFCGKPVSMSPSNNGAIHFVIMTANSSSNFKNVCFTFDGSKWDTIVW